MRHAPIKNIDAVKGKPSELKFLINYLKPHKRLLTAAAIALLVTSCSILAIGKGVGFLVDNGMQAGNSHLLNTALFTLMVLTAILAAGTYARYYFITMVGEHVVADMRNDIYRHILRLSQDFLETNSSGEITSRLTTDASLIQSVVGSSISIALRNLVLFFGGVTLLFFTSPKLTAIVCLVIPFVVIPIIILGRRLRRLSRTTQDKIADLSTRAEESVFGLKDIQSYTRESIETQHFESLVSSSLTTATERTEVRALLTAIVIMCIFGAVGFVLWIGGHDVVNDQMSAGALSSFVFYAIIVAGSVGALSEVIGDIQRAAGAAERIREFLDVVPAISDAAVPASLKSPVKGAITFDNVTFQYPSQKERTALKNISLKITPGETIAVVGPSGSGKTTLFQLLLRFYDYVHGSITLDGAETKDIPVEELRRQYAIVAQDPIIFTGTIYDNILWGNAQANEAAVHEAAQAAAATEFIEKLPEGFQTRVGEKGMRLSGGQKQRIAIARAFLKDAKILLLDEATSALDSENETLVQEALHALMKNRTTIVIAHRLATIKEADRIVVLDRGKIQEIGTHKELLKNKALYAKLAKLQFKL